MQFTADDVAPMARGAAVLGGGGAGDPFVAEIMLAEMLADGRAVEVVSLSELADDEIELAPFALIGSPHALSEKLLGTREMATLFAGNALRARTPAAVLPYEMAGLNALYPLAVAAELGVPCVDADFVGHGVPSLDLTMLELDAAQPDSYLLCDPRGRTVMMQKSGALSVDRLLRPVVETMGWLAVLSTSSLTVGFCRQHSLAGTLTRCLELGRMFEHLPSLDDASAAAMIEHRNGAVIGRGVVTERLASGDGRGVRTTLTVEADDLADPPLRIELRNEFHLVVREGLVLASAPDVLVIVDRVSWRPLPVEDVEPGRDVCVLALPAHQRWRTPEGVALAGPRALGYGVDYVEFDTGVRS